MRDRYPAHPTDRIKTNHDVYRYKAYEFNNNILKGDKNPQDVSAQLEVMLEEFEELEEEVSQWIRVSEYEKSNPPFPEIERDMAEEAADVLITVFLLCDMMQINLREAYRQKMEYNMKKSGKKDRNGKVIDNAEEN